MSALSLVLVSSFLVFSVASASPFLDPEALVTNKFVDDGDDGAAPASAAAAKRDPEVAAPLILDKREKKNYYHHFGRRPMKEYFHRNLRDDNYLSSSVQSGGSSGPDPVLSGFSTPELARLLRLLDDWQRDRELPMGERDQRILWYLIDSYQRHLQQD